MIKYKKLFCIIVIILLLIPTFSTAITEIDNGTYRIYPVIRRIRE